MTRGATGIATVRAFVALEVDDAMRARVAGSMEQLREQIRGVRWVARQAIHVTLRFLGESTREALDRVARDLRAVAAACPLAEARVAGLGVFPERGSPRVLWLGLDLPPSVLEMQAQCERAAVAAGFPREDRPFQSHLTLGRWRDRAQRPTLPRLDLGVTALDAVVLFRSELRPTGAVYTPIETFRLGTG
ncbi:MAG: RNA 2',3'-cyclic phosphodiesterase [Acidobacteria bacterium]|nr:RNA 2',3'-cyclic phosphodiesterase [Acidobacteriota bacterium]